MISKNLSYKTLVRYNLSHSLWVSALTLLGTLSTLLLPLFVTQQNYQLDLKNYAVNAFKAATPEILLNNAQKSIYLYLSFDNIAIKIVLCIVAFLCGIAMFRYLHDRQKVDFFHALPINRGKLFILRYVSGLLAVLPLLLIVYLVSIGTAVAMGFHGMLTGAILFQSILGHICFFLLNYTIAVLCTILTGSTVISVLLAIWVEFSVPLFLLMYQLWQTFYYDTYLNPTPREIAVTLGGSSIVKYFASTSTMKDINVLVDSTLTTSGFHALIYPVVGTLIVLMLSYILFVRRKSECSGMALAFSKIKVPFQIYMCLFMGWVFAILFQQLFLIQEGWKWFGLIFGTVFCHAVVEMICAYDFKAMFHHWKQMLVVCVAAVAVMLGIQNDILGFDRYLPNESNITAVGLKSLADRPYFKYNTDAVLTDPESIHAVYTLASRCVSHTDAEPIEKPSNIQIIYHLKNGNQVYRQYDISRFDEDLNDLLTQESYIKTYVGLQQLSIPQDAKDGDFKLEISDMVFNEITDKNTIYMIENVDAIRMIVESLKAEQIKNARAHMYEIPVFEMYLTKNQKKYETNIKQATSSSAISNIIIYPSDTHTIALIADFFGLTPASLHEQPVTEITIDVEDPTAEEDVEAYHQTITVQDQAQIEELIQDAYSTNQSYYAGKCVEWDEFKEQYYVSIQIKYQLTENNTQTNGYRSVKYPKGKTPIALLQKLTGKPLALQ